MESYNWWYFSDCVEEKEQTKEIYFIFLLFFFLRGEKSEKFLSLLECYDINEILNYYDQNRIQIDS